MKPIPGDEIEKWPIP